MKNKKPIFKGKYIFNKKEIAVIVTVALLNVITTMTLTKRNYIDGFEDARTL
jgi:hypothetical protein